MKSRYGLTTATLLFLAALVPISNVGATSQPPTLPSMQGRAASIASTANASPPIDNDGCLVKVPNLHSCPLQNGTPKVKDQDKWEFIVTPAGTNGCPGGISISWTDYTQANVMRTKIIKPSSDIHTWQCVYDFPTAGHSGSLSPGASFVDISQQWNPTKDGRFYTARGPHILQDWCVYKDGAHMRCPLLAGGPGVINSVKTWQFIVTPPAALGCPGAVWITWSNGTGSKVNRTAITTATSTQAAQCVFETAANGHPGPVNQSITSVGNSAGNFLRFSSYMDIGAKWTGSFYVSKGPKA